MDGKVLREKHFVRNMLGSLTRLKVTFKYFKIKAVFFKIKVVLFFNYLNNIFPGTFLLSYSYSYQSYRSLFCLRSLVHLGWRAF